MFYKSQYILKTIALGLLVNILLQVFIPTLSLALTTGPSAPEYSSFEPVDATDMVNIATGDLVYTLPVVEVPSPEGSFPLAMSYHAGIKPDQEASWVGLGWTLNAGAINRYVNMVPDDALNNISVIHDYYEGDLNEELGTSSSIGWGKATFQSGFTIIKDANRGYGLGHVSGVSYENRSYAFGGNTFGEKYTTTGVHYGVGASAYGESIGASYTTVWDSKGRTSSYISENQSSHFVGNTLTSNSNRGSVTGARNQDVGISVTGNHTSVKNGADINVVIPVNINGIDFTFGGSYSSHRYYMDNIDDSYGFGVLYFNEVLQKIGANYTKGFFDVYRLNTPNSLSTDNVETLNGGALPANDTYMVNAQGLLGNIEPCQFEYATLPGQNRAPLQRQYEKEFSTPMGFRFVGDLSNSFLWESNDFETYSYSQWEDYLTNSARKVGEAKVDYNITSDIEGFKKSSNQLASSSHVEYYTNRQINSGLANGLIVPNNRENSFSSIGYDLILNDNIGGFKVTNKSGLTYHFSLPVYNLEETEKIITTQGNGGSRTISKKMPYAYTWLLTAITGSDYVDRGLIGMLDNADYGYWVNFSYGKWTDQHAYRTPTAGAQKNIDGHGSFYSYGKKQLYYLNSIQTRTHTALFVKDLRKDGRGVASCELGGFYNTIDGNGNLLQDGASAGSLKLNKILLCENRTLKKWLQDNMGIGSTEELYKYRKRTDSYKQTINGNFKYTKVQEWDNIIDVNDIEGYDIAKEVAIKNVELNTSYDLCKGTPNSFTVNNFFVPTSLNVDGKLTLNSIQVYDRQHEMFLPPTSFEYSSTNPNYSQYKKDVWGYYKSDWNPIDNEKVYQACTQESARSIDAWSLVKINTALGASITIDYESDRSTASKLIKNGNCSIKDIEVTSVPDEFKVYTYTTGTLQQFQPGNEVLVGLQFKMASTELYLCSIVNIGNDNNKGNYILVKSERLYRNETGNIINEVLAMGTLEYVIDNNYQEYGGGLRVKSLSVSDGINTNTRKYAYEQGITSYFPIEMHVHYAMNYSANTYSDPFNPQWAVNILQFKNYVTERTYKWYSPLLATAVVTPYPGVIYSKVIVSEESFEQNQKKNISDGYNEYVFSTANDMPNISEIRSEKTILGVVPRRKYIQLTDYTSRVGLLKSVRKKKTGDVDVTNFLSSTNYTYLHELPNAEDVLKNDFNSQGVLEQLYRESKYYGLVNTYTKISSQPTIQLETITKNNKLGITESSKIIALDFFSGDPVASIFQDGTSNTYMTVSKPAYKIYGKMGLMTTSYSNEHMLSQSAGSATYKVSLNTGLSPYNINSYNKLGLVSANALFWDVTGNSPFLKSNYIWVGDDNVLLNSDGTYSITNFTAFNGLDASQTGWLRSSKVNLWDNYSHPLQMEDVNGNNAVTFMDPNSEYTVFSVSNALPNEVAYNGAEFAKYYNTTTITDGRVNFKLNDATILATGLNVNTGNYALKVNPNEEGFSTVITTKPNRVYEVSAWVYMPGNAENNLLNAQLVVLDNTSGAVVKIINPTISKKSGANYLLKDTFKSTSTGGNYKVVCKTLDTSPRALFFDDFCVKPQTSSMAVFIYDQDKGQISHIINNEAMYNRFEYDNAGNLSASYKQLIDPVKREYVVSRSKINYGKNK